MSATDPRRLVDWTEHPDGRLVASYRRDDLEVYEIASHVWRCRVTSPIRGTYVGGGASCEDAMEDALRFVGHPDIDNGRGFTRPELRGMNRTDRDMRIESARDRFMDRIEREDAMAVSAMIRGVEAFLDYLHVVEERAMRRESIPVDADRVEVGRENMEIDALHDAVGEDEEDEEPAEVES